MARYNPLSSVADKTGEENSVDNVSDVIKNILGKNMKNRRLQKSPSPFEKDGDGSKTQCESTEINGRHVKIAQVRNISRLSNNSESNSDIDSCERSIESETLVPVANKIPYDPCITTLEFKSETHVLEVPVEVVSSAIYSWSKNNDVSCLQSSQKLNENIKEK